MIGERIRRIRRSKKLSQGDLAKRSGLNRSYLSMVENSHSSPTVKVVERIAKALGVPVQDLITDIDDKHYVYEGEEIIEMYDGLKEFLADDDERMLTQPTEAEVGELRCIQFRGSFKPDKQFYRSALVSLRRSKKSDSSKI